MKRKIALFACCALVVSIGWTAAVNDIAEEMIDKARHFLISLDADKKDQATFAFEDDERLNWHFIPRDREGLPYKELSPAQRRLADRLLGTALSQLSMPRLRAVSTMRSGPICMPSRATGTLSERSIASRSVTSPRNRPS